MAQKNNPHSEHRSRVRKRFLNEGLSGFEDHNILEFLLFYSIPQKDTNELAHQLIEKFGSLSGVFDADFNLLVNTDGIGEYTATLIKLIPQLSRAYLMDKQTRYPKFSDIHKLGTYLTNYFIGAVNEKMIAVFLNNSAEIIDIIPISEGVVNRTNISVRKIAESAFVRHASFVVLAHNHPDGDSRPSEEDITLTNNLIKLFDNLELPLIEHIVVGGSNYTGIITKESSGLKYKSFT